MYRGKRMREMKFRFIFKDGAFFATRYKTLSELLDCSFAQEEMEEDINSEAVTFDDYLPDYEVFKNEYAGLKDKNKKEIYQNDIVKANGELFIVTKISSAFALIKLNGDFYEYMCNICDMMGKVYEIIGNIHENKELLK